MAKDNQYTSGLRLASFLDKWPRDEIVSPVDLVKAGLLYCGPGDLWWNYVIGLQDIPLKEYLKHFPFCNFAKVRATEILNQDYTNMTQCNMTQCNMTSEQIYRIFCK